MEGNRKKRVGSNDQGNKTLWTWVGPPVRGYGAKGPRMSWGRNCGREDRRKLKRGWQPSLPETKQAFPGGDGGPPAVPLNGESKPGKGEVPRKKKERVKGR